MLRIILVNLDYFLDIQPPGRQLSIQSPTDEEDANWIPHNDPPMHTLHLHTLSQRNDPCIASP